MDGRWTMPESFPDLANGKLQIWRIDLGDMGATQAESQSLLEISAAVLSSDERDRAARMRAGGPREEFTVARGSLRRLLGVAVCKDPARLVIEKGEHGKPFLRGVAGVVQPTFNVAHSHGIILIALSAVGEVGVDVEFMDRTVELNDVARAAFHVDEVARVEQAGSLEERLEVFYRCWTRKEALLKADGRGLILEPTTFVAGSDEPKEQCVNLQGLFPGKEYFVRAIEVGSRHRAALATTERGVAVQLVQFPTRMGATFPE